MSTIFRGRLAELYDLFYADKPYAGEARFVAGCLKRFGPARKLVELACGTGRHARAFERLGYDVTATDSSADMLARARRRAAAEKSRIAFRRADLRRLELPPAQFDAAVCLFDSIGYVETDAGVAAALAGVRRSLRPGGLFVFEFWHAPAMLRRFDPVRVRTWRSGRAEIVRISRTTIDAAKRVGQVNYLVLELRGDGSYGRTDEVHRCRAFHAPEMRKLLRAAQLEPLKMYAGFSRREKLTDQDWHVVAVARRPKSTGRNISRKARQRQDKRYFAQSTPRTQRKTRSRL
jgi:SAM-dependent methyltransferase